MATLNIFWFRRDLRFADNAGLFYALRNGNTLPIFIFDENIIGELPKNDARVSFIHSLLRDMNANLGKTGKSLAVFHGDPVTVFQKLIREHTIGTVYTNADYEPYAIARDKAVEELLRQNGAGFQAFKDHVIFEKDEIIKDDGTPYVVFTPYGKRWKDKLTQNLLSRYESETLLGNIAKHDYPFLGLSDIGFTTSKTSVPIFDISPEMVQNYQQSRNFPALAQTSNLSPHLRFGAVSIRSVVSAAANTDETFLNELIWREFFIQILWHVPQTVTKSFRAKYDSVKWRNDETDFKKWCEGKTGFPIVDAGMRQLNETGLMHNRVRMITAGFLCKHLLIDWRWGEAYFALKLLDYEQASNVGNWQWAAGSGVDAAPYFRIFNPSEQAKKFDRDLEYIRRWIPELEDFSYPEPIVDHKEARERCLKVYREALGY